MYLFIFVSVQVSETTGSVLAFSHTSLLWIKEKIQIFWKGFNKKKIYNVYIYTWVMLSVVSETIAPCGMHL